MNDRLKLVSSRQGKNNLNFSKWVIFFVNNSISGGLLGEFLKTPYIKFLPPNSLLWKFISD